MSTPRVTVNGRLAEDPALKFTQQGKAVARLRIVAADRKKQGDEWVDGDTLWISATAWEKLAENAAESLKRGDLVSVSGRLVTEEWTDREGNKRSAITLKVDDIAASLAFRTLPHGGAVHEERAAAVGAPSDDPWVTPAAATSTTPEVPIPF